MQLKAYPALFGDFILHGAETEIITGVITSIPPLYILDHQADFKSQMLKVVQNFAKRFDILIETCSIFRRATAHTLNHQAVVPQTSIAFTVKTRIIKWIDFQRHLNLSASLE